jgi:hypothetical protein
MNIREIDLNKLNCMTKYPSILTYHKLGEKGRLTEEVQVPFGDEIYATEKVDGTNARIIFYPPDNSILIGSREDLLWHQKDLLFTPCMSIVETLKPFIRWLDEFSCAFREVWRKSYWPIVIYGEVYGKGINKGSKNYSSTKNGFRVFDVVFLHNWEEIIKWPVENISSWREHGGQIFLDAADLPEWCKEYGLASVPTVPIANLPTGLKETYDWLCQYKHSQAALDETAKKEAEGVVIRTNDRKSIAKLRFEDYERTLRKNG